MLRNKKPDDASLFSPKGRRNNLALLLAVIAFLIVTVIVVYVANAAERHGGGGGGPTNPCASLKMPSLGPGVVCARGAGGAFAWLTSGTPASSGVGTPAGLTLQHQYTASDADCVTESACQGHCFDDHCSFYSYDSSKAAKSPNCLSSGSVCSTYSGPLPATISVGTTPYTTGGIPSRLLPPA